jgi:predicted molibdopterin-dependent oxidoreductase YjgC
LTLLHRPGLGTSFGRGGATTFQQDLQNADCILIEGSNMAECHPVGFQWVMEAKARGATVIHVDGARAAGRKRPGHPGRNRPVPTDGGRPAPMRSQGPA